MSEATTRRANLVIAALLLVASVELVNTAWIGDDAAITLRSVLNLLHGYGPTYNPDERVQTFTHPLWFLLISATSLVIRNVFVATFALSVATSLAFIGVLVTRVALTLRTGILAAGVLLLSKAYVDFAASGLENPLSHLLLAGAVVLGARAVAAPTSRRMTPFFVICSLIFLSRPDYVLLVAPLALVVASAGRTTPRIVLQSIAIGALPAIGWTLFSLYYYGFAFPNTAYAKLGSGVAHSELVAQGFVYLRDSFARDPLTLASIAAALGLAIRGSALDRALAIGTVIYIAYVVNIGGDFMTGRFLTAPLVAAACILARSDLPGAWVTALAVAAVLLAVPTLKMTVFSGPGFEDTKINEDTGIADERGYYFHRYGMRPAPAGAFAVPPWVITRRSVVVLCANLGYTGISEGPGTHIIDTCALADPLLARLPAERTRKWRIGHFTRQLPTDYEQSVADGANLLPDAATHRYYESIRLITRGPLNSLERWKEIVRMNLGHVATPDWNMYYATKVPRTSAER